MVAGVLAGVLSATWAAGSAPAWAKAAKKKAPAPAETAVTPAAGAEPPAEKPAAQAADTEKPTPKADPEATEQDAVKPDAEGHVNFGSSKAAKGKITVKAPPGDNVKVFLEGRYFGKAPQTIGRVPPGDYIVEAVYPNGKTVSKAVSISREEEQVVELTSATAADAAAATSGMSSDEAHHRIHNALLYGGIATGGLLAAGVGLGLWERSVQSDYNNTPHGAGATSAQQAKADDLKTKGNRLALGANACFIAAGAAAVVAVIYAYPAFRSEKKAAKSGEEQPPNLSFMILPAKDGVHAGLGLTF